MIFFDGAGVWELILKGIAKEHGLFELPKLRNDFRGNSRHDKACCSYLLTASVLHVIDLLEVACQSLQRCRPADNQTVEIIDEINRRFREHGCGYQYENGEFMRVDSQFIHAEVVKPVLLLLLDKAFKGADRVTSSS